VHSVIGVVTPFKKRVADPMELSFGNAASLQIPHFDATHFANGEQAEDALGPKRAYPGMSTKRPEPTSVASSI
jgi:hypothetical protein